MFLKPILLEVSEHGAENRDFETGVLTPECDEDVTREPHENSALAYRSFRLRSVSGARGAGIRRAVAGGR